MFDGLDSDVFVSGSENGLVLENVSEGFAEAEFFDCLGRSAGRAELAPGEIRRVPVPAEGMLNVRTGKGPRK